MLRRQGGLFSWDKTPGKDCAKKGQRRTWRKLGHTWWADRPRRKQCVWIRRLARRGCRLCPKAYQTQLRRNISFSYFKLALLKHPLCLALDRFKSPVSATLAERVRAASISLPMGTALRASAPERITFVYPGFRRSARDECSTSRGAPGTRPRIRFVMPFGRARGAPPSPRSGAVRAQSPQAIDRLCLAPRGEADGRHAAATPPDAGRPAPGAAPATSGRTSRFAPRCRPERN